MKPLISVTLLLYKPGPYLAPCLASILAQSYDNFELLVIDNNSADETVQRVRSLIEEAQSAGRRTPFYKIIVNRENRGFAAGQNQGIHESRGEIVVMANQDVVMDVDFLEQVAVPFQEKTVASVQAKILRLKMDGEDLGRTDIIDTTGLVILKNRRIIARGQGRRDDGQFDREEEIFGIDGALPAYRREALEDVKICLAGESEYFDEDFYMYKEDVDLAWRLRLNGWRAVYAPRAIAWHARTAGDSAATGYLGIVRERLKINKFGKYHSFKNQRLMQIKNEQAGLLLKHIFRFIPKEVASWLYVLLFERYTWRAIKELFCQAPRAWRKRRIIMAHKKVGEKEMAVWFK